MPTILPAAAGGYKQKSISFVFNDKRPSCLATEYPGFVYLLNKFKARNKAIVFLAVVMIATAVKTLNFVVEQMHGN